MTRVPSRWSQVPAGQALEGQRLAGLVVAGLVLAGLTACPRTAGAAPPAAAGTRGPIVPRPGVGLTLRTIAGRPSAVTRVGDVIVVTSLTTGDGFLEVHVLLRNAGNRPVPVGSGDFLVLSAGVEPVQPLEPGHSIWLRYGLTVEELESVDRRRSPDEPTFGPRDASRDFAAGIPEAYQPSRQREEQRLEAARELHRLQKARLPSRESLAPGAVRPVSLVFQRNHLEVPVVLRIGPAARPRLVVFSR